MTDPDGVPSAPARRFGSPLVGLRLALSWLTVLPISGPADIDRTNAGRAMVATPLVGLLLGGLMAAVAFAGSGLGLGPVVAGALAVAAHALATRGMHIDGLADTADGLGSYGPPERARGIMLAGDGGPFGGAAIALGVLIDAAAIARAIEVDLLPAIVAAAVIGRLAVVLICAAPFAPAAPTGFGALVAATVSRPAAAVWVVIAAAASAVVVEDRWWQGPIVVVTVAAVVVALARHAVRRTGGLSGDILGAAIEIGFVLAMIGLLIGS